MQNLDDTQPVRPVTVMPDEEQPRSGAPGCLVWGLIGLMVIGFAGLIIALAGFAGWSQGQRIAQNNATATTNAVISDQINRLPGDLNSKNQVLVKARLDYLVTLTPAVPGVLDFAQTATAMSIPTATPSPTATQPPAAKATEAATSIPLAPSGSATPDLTALLQQAQTATASSDWDTAINTLDTIMGYDGNFQTSAVHALMFDALTKKALSLYRGGDASRLAEANQLTDRASQFGNIESSEANYESIIASQYIDAVNAIGVDYNLAIRKLTALYSQAPSYRDVFQKLVGQYIGYGDALAQGGQPCSAVAQYQSALSLQDNASVTAKRDAAQTACTTQATQGISGTPGPDGIAPVGVAPVGAQPTPG